jgi:hypothetical protein
VADVLINRCTLRVVRRGGWSWGADPRRLLESVVQAFPRLLARRLAELLPDDAEAEISAPLRLNISVRLSELLALGAVDDGQTVAAESRLAALGDLFEHSLREHPAFRQFVRPETDAAAEPPPPEGAREDDEGPEVARRSPLLRLLAGWRARGELELRLSAFAPATLEAWHSALLDTDEASPRASAPLTAESVTRFVRELAAQGPRGALTRAEILRRRVAIAVEVVESLGASPRDEALRRALEGALPLAETRPTGDAAAAREGRDAPREADAMARVMREPRAPAEAEAGPPAATPAALRAPRSYEVQVSSALPFLLLGPLAQFGYLATLAAALEAARLSDDAPLFAAALAYKVLPPPERGWRRRPAAALAAAGFAGLAEPPPEQSLTLFSERIAPHVSALDAALAHVLVRGHNPLKPLALCRTRGASPGLLLADVEGIFPVAWAGDFEGLLPTLRQFGQTTLLVPAETADPALLRSLDEGGFLFITDAPPARGETWRPLRRAPAERWHTNDHSGAEKNLLRAARLLADACEEAGRLWQSLGVERVGVPLAPDARLETSLTLAAAFALGTISWTLWRAREPVNPLLALERFGDLDARVRFGGRAVSVRLPLGRRYRDLYEHGLLEAVAEVPWLDGRRVEFTGG